MKKFTPLLLLAASALGWPDANPSVYAAHTTKAAPQPNAAPKFAVLVGITNYTRDNISKLQGCLNDVRDMKTKLVHNFGFADDRGHVTVLTNEKATHDGIVRAIRSQLRDQARLHPDGTFLFYFSGHGAQSSDDHDKTHQTLVTYDMDLLDDDLGLLCREIRGVPGFKGSLTVILDSCHSYAASRAPRLPGAPHVRAAPDDPSRVGPPLKEDVPLTGNAGAGGFAAFSGCLATQSSYEKLFSVASAKVGSKDPASQEYHGVLTYHLLQFMGADSAATGTTNGQMWGQVVRAMSSPDQSPQLEGGHPNQLFLGGSENKDVPPPTYSLKGTTLTFDRGVEAGAVKGGFISILNDGKTMGQLAITSADVGTASATVPADLKIAPTGTVKLLTPFFGAEPLKVGWDSDIPADNPVVKRLQRVYDEGHQQFVRLAKPGETDVTLMRSDSAKEFHDGKPAVPGYIVSDNQTIFGVFFPATADGDIAEEDQARLTDVLENYAAQRNVQKLSNDSPDRTAVTAAVTFTAKRVNGAVDKKGEWHADKKNPGLETVRLADGLPLGQGVRFDVQNKTRNQLHVALLWLGQDGSITALQDESGRQDITLKPANQPESAAHTANYTVSDRTGNETLKLFVSHQPINPWYLERAGIKRGEAAKGGPPSPFDIIAGQALGTREPRIATDRPNFDSWDAAGFALKIVPAAR